MIKTVIKCKQNPSHLSHIHAYLMVTGSQKLRMEMMNWIDFIMENVYVYWQILNFMLLFICFQPKKGGGISFNSTVPLTKTSEKMIQLILHEYSILLVEEMLSCWKWICCKHLFTLHYLMVHLGDYVFEKVWSIKNNVLLITFYKKICIDGFIFYK